MAPSLTDRLARIRERVEIVKRRGGLDQQVRLVAVTKTHPARTIVEAVQAGITDIGENRVQEAREKFSELPAGLGVNRRLIGHLQSNKINPAIGLFDCIDSVDSIKLATKISKKAVNLNRCIQVLLEVNTSGEAEKYGFKPANLSHMLACFDLPGLKIDGLMTVGPLTADKQKIRKAFSFLRNLKTDLNRQKNDGRDDMTVLSMGMSGDYELAVEEGSTMVRLGTALFGPRGIYRAQ